MRLCCIGYRLFGPGSSTSIVIVCGVGDGWNIPLHSAWTVRDRPPPNRRRVRSSRFDACRGIPIRYLAWSLS